MEPDKNPNPLLRSSVSMFIQDSRITAVCNAEPPPRAPSIANTSLVPRRPSYFSVTSYTSSTSGGGLALGGGSNLNYRTPSPRACSSSPVRFPGRELFHQIIREEEDPPPPRRRSTLSLEPVLFCELKNTLPSIKEDRAYTSVNLTLRAPSSQSSVTGGDHSEQGATTIFHHNLNAGTSSSGNLEVDGSGANLMYSSYSSTSRDGFEAQVQIQFGPGGGTFTACRRRRVSQERELAKNMNNISIRQQMGRDLLSAQTERKDKLRNAIQERKCVLAKLQTEIGQLKSQLQVRGGFSELEKLKQENQRLRIECNYMSRQVDLYQNGSVPLGETNEAFYQGINPGQSLNALFGITNNRRKIGGPGGQPPPRPPPPKFLQSAQGQGESKPEEGLEQGEWRCSMCTFQNHRDLDFCEQCQMVRVKNPTGQQQQGQYQYQYQYHGQN